MTATGRGRRSLLCRIGWHRSICWNYTLWGSYRSCNDCGARL